MRDLIEFIKEIPKMIKSSDGLESLMGLIALCVLVPIVLLIGTVVYIVISLIVS